MREAHVAVGCPSAAATMLRTFQVQGNTLKFKSMAAKNLADETKKGIRYGTQDLSS